MLLDDTKYTAYVYDIERELEEIEAQEEKQHIAFLPDIEKSLTAIPRAILENPKQSNTQLVLYRPPDLLARAESQSQRQNEDNAVAVNSVAVNSATVNPVAVNSVVDAVDVDSGKIASPKHLSSNHVLRRRYNNHTRESGSLEGHKLETHDEMDLDL
jgi:hypothetical protein